MTADDLRIFVVEALGMLRHSRDGLDDEAFLEACRLIGRLGRVEILKAVELEADGLAPAEIAPQVTWPAAAEVTGLEGVPEDELTDHQRQARNFRADAIADQIRAMDASRRVISILSRPSCVRPGPAGDD